MISVAVPCSALPSSVAVVVAGVSVMVEEEDFRMTALPAGISLFATSVMVSWLPLSALMEHRRLCIGSEALRSVSIVVGSPVFARCTLVGGDVEGA